MSLLGITRGREEKRAVLDNKIAHGRDEVNQSIQAIQSGAQLMRTFGGANKLVREAGRARTTR